MSYLTLVVKGHGAAVTNAAAERGIPFVFLNETKTETVGKVGEQFRDAVAKWFCEVPAMVPGSGFPDGTLLLYSSHEDDCSIEHEGKKFLSGGSQDTHYRNKKTGRQESSIVGYLGEIPNSYLQYGNLKDWHGNIIGKFRVLSHWRTPRSFVSLEMYSIEAFVNSVRYVGRSAGEGMIFKGKRSSRQ